MSAQFLYVAAVEGPVIGQYTAGARAIFLIAINAATAVKNNPASSQAQIDQAILDLAQAKATFEAAKISLHANMWGLGIVQDQKPVGVSLMEGKKSTNEARVFFFTVKPGQHQLELSNTAKLPCVIGSFTESFHTLPSIEPMSIQP